MPDPDTTPAADLRQRIATAIRDATCTGDCGQAEQECQDHRIQPVVWHHGVLAAVEATPEQIADVAIAVRDQEMEALRERLRKAERAVDLLAGSHRRAEEAEAALAAGIPLVCSDERHQAKVTALEASIGRARKWIAGEPVTARSSFGEGYREALRDISDLLTAADQMEQQ